MDERQRRDGDGSAAEATTDWSGEESDRRGDRDGHADGRSPYAAFGDLLDDIRTLRAYIAHYAAARIDQAKVSGQRLALLALAGLLALVALLVAWSTAVVLILAGAAGGVAAATGSVWIGCIVAGAGFLFLKAAGIAAAVALWRRSQRRSLAEKYRERRDVEEARAHDRGRETTSRREGRT